MSRSDHDTLNKLLYDYYDGEIDPSQKIAVEAHLTVCRECARELDSWRRTAGVLFAKRNIEAPGDFAEGVMRRIEKKQEDGWWARLCRRPRLALAGAAALAFAFYFAQPEPKPPVSEETLAGAEIEPGADLDFEEWVAGEASGEDDDRSIGTAIEEYFL
ncbi:MAG: zf-HC2 domain-containing protein [Elusimicrobia bacterium]|nr:zf-HC2 domain-containing protein [Elusimicrobiota bacterium]